MLPIINRFAIVILTSVVCAAATAATTQKTTKAKQPSALKVKQGNYTPRGKLTRREFVEKAFGVKFGEELAKYVKPDNDGDADLGVMHKKLASPVCGLKDALFFVSRSGELERIQLSPQSPAKREQGIKATKARLDRFSQTAGKWLGIKSFEPQESIVGDSEEGKAWNLARVFEEDGLKVKAAVECIEKGKSVMAYGCSLTISFTEAKAAGKTEDAQVEPTMTADQLFTRSYPFPDEVKALLDEKAGTTAIHTKVCAGDGAAYEEMYAKYKAWFKTQGVDWPMQNENRRAGIVYARATERLRITNTEANLDKIEKLLAK